MTATTTLPELFSQFLEQEGIPADKLWYDNAAPVIVDSFADLGTPGTVDENLLAEKLWWWRYAEGDRWKVIFNHKSHPDWWKILKPLYRDYFYLSAYLYEFRARYGDRYQWDFGRPWIKCSVEHRRMMECLWPASTPAIQCTPNDLEKKNWVKLDRRFNLNVNNEVLVRLFQEEIETLRARLKIPNPGKGRGVRRRQFSWKAIEAMDMRHFTGCAMNASERSQVSKEKRRYEEACAGVGLVP